jgi:hypothetical protein
MHWKATSVMEERIFCGRRTSRCANPACGGTDEDVCQPRCNYENFLIMSVILARW